MAHIAKQGKKTTKKQQNKKYKNKNKMCRGDQSSLFALSDLSWNSLPCSHQQTFIIATFYRPPATTISFYSTSSAPEKENTISNRLGTPLSRGLRSQKGLRPFNPLQNRGGMWFYIVHITS